MRCPKCQFENPDDLLYCGKCASLLRLSEKDEFTQAETIQTPKEELTTGTTFAGRYQIIEEIGKGGMGKVYKVLDKEININVALKLIKPEIAADKKTIERFRNELKTAREIAHKNVCRMYDLNKEEGSYYITMEYVPGEDLGRLIRKIGQLPTGKAISIAKQICEGLSEAHRLGVIHRDLKPQNIMVDEEGNARIMDFGIARSLKAEGVTEAGMMIGTPAYMSPEQVEGKKTDHSSDIYSLGIILYEMVTGRVPFEGDTPLSVAMKHKSETPKDPKDLNPQIPEELNHLILKCMEKKREERYQTAEELLLGLKDVEEKLPTTEKVIAKRKPLTSKEITITLGLKKAFIPVLLLVLIVAVIFITWQFWPKKETASVPSDKPTLAIMYFENNTGDESLDHWRAALSELLINDLSQSKYVNVLRGDKLFNILKELDQLEAEKYSSEILQEVASKARATHILQGDYIKAGENFRINIMLHNAGTEELIGSEKVEGKGEESFFPMVDELTKKIKANLKLSLDEIEDDIDREIGKIITSSPKAFRHYIEGRKYFNQDDHQSSLEHMEEAVAIDPEFAMAYRSMARSYEALADFSKRDKHIQKAMELSDRVSVREHYLIKGDFYGMSEETWDEAIEAYNNLLQLYPDDYVGNNNLGVLYSNLEETDKAIERHKVNVKNNPENYYSYVNLATAYSSKGMYDEAIEVLESYIKNYSDLAYPHFRLAGTYLCQGKLELALEKINKAISLGPVNYRFHNVRGNIYYAMEDLAAAEKAYQELLKFEEKASHLVGRVGLATLYAFQGRFEEAINQYKEGIELAQELDQIRWEYGLNYGMAYRLLRIERLEEALEKCQEASQLATEVSESAQKRTLCLKGLIYLKMKSIEKAKKVSQELKELFEKGIRKKEIERYYHIAGLIELEKENFPKALEYLNKSISLLPSQFDSEYFDDHAFFIEPLALAYYKQGELSRAEEEYKKIISLTTGRLGEPVIYVKSHYMLGKIYEEKVMKDKAIVYYQKFLDLWKEADSGIPEVADAKKRLASLKVN